jgi:hypothetical protein
MAEASRLPAGRSGLSKACSWAALGCLGPAGALTQRCPSPAGLPATAPTLRVLCRSKAQVEAALQLPWLTEIVLDFLEVSCTCWPMHPSRKEGTHNEGVSATSRSALFPRCPRKLLALAPSLAAPAPVLARPLLHRCTGCARHALPCAPSAAARWWPRRACLSQGRSGWRLSTCAWALTPCCCAALGCCISWPVGVAKVCPWGQWQGPLQPVFAPVIVAEPRTHGCLCRLRLARRRPRPHLVHAAPARTALPCQARSSRGWVPQFQLWRATSASTPAMR